MKVKSLEELKKIRDEYQSKVSLRQENGENKGDTIEILIGMATCGISSGAKETLNAFVDEIEKEVLSNVKIVSVGCIGYCHSEPTVQINIPGNKPVLYGNVKKEKVAEIIKKHIMGGKLIEDMVLKVDFERA